VRPTDRRDTAARPWINFGPLSLTETIRPVNAVGLSRQHYDIDKISSSVVFFTA
jgi:hypothetical protein